MYFTEYASPVGNLLLTADDQSLTGLRMNTPAPADGSCDGSHPVLEKARRWLDAYFRGEERQPDFPLNPGGTPFQRQVWEILLTIPYGTTRTYGEIARRIATTGGGEKMSAQAVGQAVGRNPISILIPCHRVVGTKGQLTGYAGSLDKKVWLLRHEGWLPANQESN